MSSLWCLLLLPLIAQFGNCAITGCVQRDPITRDILQVLACHEGCCGYEMERQYCCEDDKIKKIYTQYDPEDGSLTIAEIFGIVVGSLAVVALFVGISFMIIKCVKDSPRDLCWWI